jgi:hypothetical protein
MVYREASLSVPDALEARLGPLGFVPSAPDERTARDAELGVVRWFHRKTWNTNRGVVLASAPRAVRRSLAYHVDVLRRVAGVVLGSSWWRQLGMQIVVEVEGALPPAAVLDGLVDKINHQGVLVQSVFAVDAQGAYTSARAWGQVVTGRFQDAIQAALDDVARGHTLRGSGEERP